jgi:hypothetical protein
MDAQINELRLSNIGVYGFFKEYQREPILLEDFMKEEEAERFRKYPNKIKKMRNNLIFLTIFQIVSSFIGMLYIIFRRSFIYILINLITLSCGLCGAYGTIKMNGKYLTAHCLFTTSITLGFLVYQLFDLFLVSDTSFGVKKRMNDNFLLFLFTLPYCYDLVVGIYNFFFIKEIAMMKPTKKDELLREKVESFVDKMNKTYSENDIEKHLERADARKCVICMEKTRDCLLSPCGHVLSCEECSKRIFENSNSFSKVKCPVCRRECQRYIKLIIS